MIPRDYQYKAVNSVWDYFKNNSGNPVIAMPTGVGKSIVIAELLRGIFAQYPTQKILILTHVKELIKQNYEKLMLLWPMAPAGIYSAGLRRKDVFDNIIFGGIGSVSGREDEFGKVDLIIIDEAHLVSPKAKTMYRKFIAGLTKINPYLKVIGLTATKYRLGQGLLIEPGGIFTDICCDMTTIDYFNWFIDQKYIVPLVPKPTETEIDIKEVRINGGELVLKELQMAANQKELTQKILQESLDIAHDRKSWLIFTTGIEHTISFAQIANSLGISCTFVHSNNAAHKMTNSQRDQAIDLFKSGNVRSIVNSNILTTGFDHPPIDYILVARPTVSPNLWVQLLGRGTRPIYADGYDLSTVEGRSAAIEASTKQNCLVGDFAGNTPRLGPINDPVIPKKKGNKAGQAPIKLCENCNTYIHASLRVCSHCGYVFPVKSKLVEQAGTMPLIRKTKNDPILKDFKVDHITYKLHTKKGSPNSIQVSYHCGKRVFREYICIEHSSYAGKVAREWWKKRSKTPVPRKTIDALDQIAGVSVSTHIRVHTNTKHPEITSHCFDGSNFDAQSPEIDRPDARIVKSLIISDKLFKSDTL